MKTRYLLSMTFMVCLTACGGSEPSAVNQQAAPKSEAQQPESSAPATPTEMFVSGQLQEVDPGAMTIVLKDIQGAEQKFAFSPRTRITGIANARELDRQEGRNATIRYIQQDDLKSAVQIHIELGS